MAGGQWRIVGDKLSLVFALSRFDPRYYMLELCLSLVLALSHSDDGCSMLKLWLSLVLPLSQYDEGYSMLKACLSLVLPLSHYDDGYSMLNLCLSLLVALSLLPGYHIIQTMISKCISYPSTKPRPPPYKKLEIYSILRQGGNISKELFHWLNVPSFVENAVLIG